MGSTTRKVVIDLGKCALKAVSDLESVRVVSPFGNTVGFLKGDVLEIKLKKIYIRIPFTKMLTIECSVK